MAESQCFYQVLLIPFLTGLLYGSEVKSVCKGDSIQLINSIQINTSDTIVSLYKNSDKHRMIASWNVDGPTISHENTSLFQDEHKNIWLINVHQSDIGKYVLKYTVGGNKTWNEEVEVDLMLSPKPTCKPLIVQSGTILKASLGGDDCGTPKASVYWQQYPNVDYEGDELMRLHSGIEAGTYYACIKGPAVRCINSSSPSLDHCTAITVKESNIQPVTGGSEVQRDSGGSTLALLTMVALILLLQLIFAVYLLRNYMKKRRKLYAELGGTELNGSKDFKEASAISSILTKPHGSKSRPISGTYARQLSKLNSLYSLSSEYFKGGDTKYFSHNCEFGSSLNFIRPGISV